MSYAIRLIPVLLLLTACAGEDPPLRTAALSDAYDAGACTGDGYEIGLADGFEGLDGDARRATCAAAGVSLGPDYDAGRAEGLVRFCEPANAATLPPDTLDAALRCPPHMRDAFLAALPEVGADQPGVWRPRIRPVFGAGISIGSGGVKPRLGGGISIGF